MSRLVFDIGGTNMRMAIAEEGVLSMSRKVPTPQDARDAIAVLSAFVREAAEMPSDSVGGIAGIIRDGIVVDSPNLASWNGFAFAEELSKETTLAVTVRNDAEIAAYGEAKMGAGEGYERVAYLTVGTGVGGALIVKAMLPSHGEVFEPGREIIPGTERTFEEFVGGAALAREFGAAPEHLPRSVFTERTPVLAAGILHVMSLWSPDVLVLNGALMNEETAFRLAEVQDAVGENSVPLVRASLGDESALYGAALA